MIEVLRDVTKEKKTDDEFKRKIKELEEFYDMAIGREIKMTELREEVERLKEELRKLRG